MVCLGCEEDSWLQSHSESVSSVPCFCPMSKQYLRGSVVYGHQIWSLPWESVLCQEPRVEFRRQSEHRPVEDSPRASVLGGDTSAARWGIESDSGGEVGDQH